MRKNRWIITGALGAAAGATCLLYLRYQRETQAAAARLRAGSQLIETKCGPVEYAIVGEGGPVLIVHGGGGGYDQGLLLAQFLGLSNRLRCIAVSRVGYLRSPLPVNASPSAQADTYAALLDKLRLPQVAVVGASAGGPSSLQFALRHPERCASLALISAISRAWAWPTLPPLAQNLAHHNAHLGHPRYR